MYKLHCFMRGFVFSSSRFVFRDGRGENPDRPSPAAAITDGSPIAGIDGKKAGDSLSRVAYRAAGYEKDVVIQRPEFIAAKDAMDKLDLAIKRENLRPDTGAKEAEKHHKEIAEAYKNARKAIDAATMAGAINEAISLKMDSIATRHYYRGLGK